MYQEGKLALTNLKNFSLIGPQMSLNQERITFTVKSTTITHLLSDISFTL